MPENSRQCRLLSSSLLSVILWVQVSSFQQRMTRISILVYMSRIIRIGRSLTAFIRNTASCINNTSFTISNCLCKVTQGGGKSAYIWAETNKIISKGKIGGPYLGLVQVAIDVHGQGHGLVNVIIGRVFQRDIDDNQVAGGFWKGISQSEEQRNLFNYFHQFMLKLRATLHRLYS